MAAGTPQNYYVKGQAPLDSKMVFANTAVLLNYISDNPLYAFNFYKGMIVYLQEEKAFYIWENPFSKEFLQKESLLVDNFIYPPGSTYEDVNYSGQAFNLIDYYYSKIDIGSWSEDDKIIEVTIQEGSNTNPFVVQDVLDLWPNAERISFIGDDTTGLKLYGSPIQLYQEFPVADWASLTYDISNSQDDYVQVARIRILEPGEIFDYAEYENLIVGNSFKEIQIVYSEQRMNKKNSMYLKPINQDSFEVYIIDNDENKRKFFGGVSGGSLTPSDPLETFPYTITDLTIGEKTITHNLGAETYLITFQDKISKEFIEIDHSPIGINKIKVRNDIEFENQVDVLIIKIN